VLLLLTLADDRAQTTATLLVAVLLGGSLPQSLVSALTNTLLGWLDLARKCMNIPLDNLVGWAGGWL